MTDSTVGKGKCLCSSVQITAQAMGHNVGVCHCSICRQWGGGPFFGLDCGSDVTFAGQEHITVFSSSDWAERGFCKKCGTHLFYRVKKDSRYFLPAGLFKSDEQLVFDHQVFIDDKPEYYSFANETQNMTGAEIFAMFTQT